MMDEVIIKTVKGTQYQIPRYRHLLTCIISDSPFRILLDKRPVSDFSTSWGKIDDPYIIPVFLPLFLEFKDDGFHTISITYWDHPCVAGSTTGLEFKNARGTYSAL